MSNVTPALVADIIRKKKKIIIFLYRFEISDDDEKEPLTGFGLLIATFRHLKNPFQILLIPLTMWSGFEQGFFGADFTAV